ncbi:MAG: hypothetical protein Ct9H300mP26_0700 [Acidimicrobiales bacterium]|jgi:hypothetical protein|nr:MAG: hypothetical protein Ct9H300mP26_0700 [Acidimicrobiales bacterium]|tara:strand:- start:1274 stop:1594 length:321 start_codon:yes stop_codon:yes gene_type:complete
MTKTAVVSVTEVENRTFSVSMVVSGVRCGLTYVILPFLAPLIGIGSGVGPWIGLPLGTVAIAANVLSIRRFWSGNRRWKLPMAVINLSVIALLFVLVAGDLTELLG